MADSHVPRLYHACLLLLPTAEVQPCSACARAIAPHALHDCYADIPQHRACICPKMVVSLHPIVARAETTVSGQNDTRWRTSLNAALLVNVSLIGAICGSTQMASHASRLTAARRCHMTCILPHASLMDQRQWVHPNVLLLQHALLGTQYCIQHSHHEATAGAGCWQRGHLGVQDPGVHTTIPAQWQPTTRYCFGTSQYLLGSPVPSGLVGHTRH